MVFYQDLLLHGNIRCPSISDNDVIQSLWDHRFLQVLCSYFPPVSYDSIAALPPGGLFCITGKCKALSCDIKKPLTRTCEGRSIPRYHLHYADPACISHSPLTQEYVKTYSSAAVRFIHRPHLFQSSGSKATFSNLFLRMSSSRWTLLSVRDNRLLLFFPAFSAFYYNWIFHDCQAGIPVFHIYSTLFRDSTISIFFSLKCMTTLTTMENTQVSAAQ